LTLEPLYNKQPTEKMSRLEIPNSGISTRSGALDLTIHHK